MGWFGFGKSTEVIDLGERFQKKKASSAKTNSSLQKPAENNAGFTPFPFFADSSTSSAMSTSSSNSSTNNMDLDGSNASEKRRKLVNRLKSMTDRLEDLSSQVYRLQQRVELLEKKSSAGY